MNPILFLSLHQRDLPARKIFVPVSAILAIQARWVFIVKEQKAKEEGSFIHVSGKEFEVAESADEVMAQILKLAQTAYHAG
jgi:hypothetical protein